MNLPGTWYREILVVASGTLVLVLIGGLLGYPLQAVFGGLILYTLWHLLQLYRFDHWLDSPKREPSPFPVGIWAGIMRSTIVMRDRGRKRKRKLSRLLSGFQESTSALPDATVVLNDKLEVEWWNKMAKGMLGLKRKIHQGCCVKDAIPDPVFGKYISSGEYSSPLQIPAPTGENVSLEIRIVPYGKGKLLLQARDITRLQQLETVRRDFVANVSHEMRTPLTVIHGYLETMGEDARDQFGDWARVIDQMRQQTSRMQRIVEDLLVLSRLESGQEPGEPEVVDVPLLLKSLHAEAQNLSGGRHRIDLDVDAAVELLANISEVESAFSNLVFNAVRYTPDGGTIILRWWEGEKGACFTVTDNGIGIEAQHIPRLTERFYRVDVGRSRQSGGTGLGLAIVKHVLMRHGGRLKIESEPGMGSAFTCLFPAAKTNRRPLAERQASS